MRTKLMSGMAAVILGMAAPAWAHEGHGHERDRYWHRHHVHERVVVREYWRPAPVRPLPMVYAVPPAPAPTPGIHIVLPDVYIPF